VSSVESWPNSRPDAASRISLALALAASAALLVAIFSGPASAAAPLVGTQAPGFYRMSLGKFEVMALSDGTHPFPVHKVLTKAEQASIGNTRKVAPLDQVSPGEADALLAQSTLTAPVEGSM
jgi:hypothetical protein